MQFKVNEGDFAIVLYATMKSLKYYASMVLELQIEGYSEHSETKAPHLEVHISRDKV